MSRLYGLGIKCIIRMYLTTIHVLRICLYHSKSLRRWLRFLQRVRSHMNSSFLHHTRLVPWYIPIAHKTAHRNPQQSTCHVIRGPTQILLCPPLHSFVHNVHVCGITVSSSCSSKQVLTQSVPCADCGADCRADCGASSFPASLLA